MTLASWSFGGHCDIQPLHAAPLDASKCFVKQLMPSEGNSVTSRWFLCQQRVHAESNGFERQIVGP